MVILVCIRLLAIKERKKSPYLVPIVESWFEYISNINKFWMPTRTKGPAHNTTINLGSYGQV